MFKKGEAKRRVLPMALGAAAAVLMAAPAGAQAQVTYRVSGTSATGCQLTSYTPLVQSGRVWGRAHFAGCSQADVYIGLARQEASGGFSAYNMTYYPRFDQTAVNYSNVGDLQCGVRYATAWRFGHAGQPVYRGDSVVPC